MSDHKQQAADKVNMLLSIGPTIRRTLNKYPGSEDLHARMLLVFVNRVPIWIALIIVGHLCIAVASHFHGTQHAQILPGIPLRMSIWGWTAGLYILAGLAILLHFKCKKTVRIRGSADIRKLQWVWIGLAILLSLWWTLGLYTLDRQPSGGSFIVAQRTFIWLTALGHVISLVLLAPNWMVMISVLVGFYLPAVHGFWVMNDASTSTSMRWISGQIFTYVVVGFFLYYDQRRLLVKQISIETERRRADELLKQRKNLLGAISHDLRQPLTTIALRLDAIKDYLPDNVQARETYSIVESQVWQLTQMVNSALDLSRLEAGHYPINPREVPLHTLLQELVTSFEVDAERRSIELRLFAPPLIVNSDKDALSRIIGNLISNALKYTPKGGTVLVGCQRRGGAIKVSVIDTGKGIDESQVKSIFNEYVQLDNPERDRQKGLGLGLSIVEGLASLLQHRIEVRSRVGAGSRFSVFVPFVGRVPAEYLSHAEKIDEENPELFGMVVIVIEDVKDVRESICSILTSWECYVISGESFEELSPYLGETLGDKAPDFLLCDYRLRGNSTGVEVVKKFRDIYANLPAAIWTGNTDPETLREIVGNGIEFISKPVRKLDMAKLLTSHMPNVKAEEHAL